MRAGSARATRRRGPTTVTRQVSAPLALLVLMCVPPARPSCRSLGQVVGNSMRVAPTGMDRFRDEAERDRAAVARAWARQERRAVNTVIVRHRERSEGPELPRGEIVLEPPPEIPEVPGDALQQMLTYMPMLAMTFGMVAMMSGAGSGALRWVGGAALGLGMGGMALGQMARGRGDRKLKLNGLRRDYLRYLGQVRHKVRRVAAAQREALAWASPEPGELHWLAAGDLARVWERRPSDDDFGSVRFGTGTQHLAVRLIPPQTKPVEDLDPLCAGALRRFMRAHARLPGLPVGISLRSFSRVALSGDADAAAAMV